MEVSISIRTLCIHLNIHFNLKHLTIGLQCFSNSLIRHPIAQSGDINAFGSFTQMKSDRGVSKSETKGKNFFEPPRTCDT